MSVDVRYDATGRWERQPDGTWRVYTQRGSGATAAPAAVVTPPDETDYVDVSGDTMTGALMLPGMPTLPNEAASKQYVDNAVAATGGTAPIPANDPPPSVGATSAVGVGAQYAREDHTHAGTTPADVATSMSAHTTATDPHPTYLTRAEGDAYYDVYGSASGGMTAHTGAVDPHAQYSTDAETAAAVSAHAAAADPHPSYLTRAEGDSFYDATGAASGAVSTHAAASDPHPTYSTAAETAAAVSAHAAAVDPHPTYLTAAEGNAAYDVAGAATSAVSTHAAATDPHPTYSTAAETAAAVSAHAAAGDPHPVYLTSAEADTAYVNTAGDTMTGALHLSNLYLENQGAAAGRIATAVGSDGKMEWRAPSSVVGDLTSDPTYIEWFATGSAGWVSTPPPTNWQEIAGAPTTPGCLIHTGGLISSVWNPNPAQPGMPYETNLGAETSTALYRIAVRARTTTTATITFGFVALDANRTKIGTGLAGLAVPVGTEWTLYTGYLTGRDEVNIAPPPGTTSTPDEATSMPIGTVYWQPQIDTNGNRVEIDAIEVHRLDYSLVAPGGIVAAGVAAGTIDADSGDFQTLRIGEGAGDGKIATSDAEGNVTWEVLDGSTFDDRFLNRTGDSAIGPIDFQGGLSVAPDDTYEEGFILVGNSPTGDLRWARPNAPMYVSPIPPTEPRMGEQWYDLTQPVWGPRMLSWRANTSSRTIPAYTDGTYHSVPTGVAYFTVPGDCVVKVDFYAQINADAETRLTVVPAVVEGTGVLETSSGVAIIAPSTQGLMTQSASFTIAVTNGAGSVAVSYGQTYPAVPTPVLVSLNSLYSMSYSGASATGFTASTQRVDATTGTGNVTGRYITHLLNPNAWESRTGFLQFAVRGVGESCKIALNWTGYSKGLNFKAMTQATIRALVLPDPAVIGSVSE